MSLGINNRTVSSDQKQIVVTCIYDKTLEIFTITRIQLTIIVRIYATLFEDPGKFDNRFMGCTGIARNV